MWVDCRIGPRPSSRTIHRPALSLMMFPRSLTARCSCLQRVALLTCLLAAMMGRPCAQAQSKGYDEAVAASSLTSDPWVPSLRTIGQDALDIVRAPARLSPSERLLTVGTAGLVLSAVSAVDRPVYRGLTDHSSPAGAATEPLAAPGRWYDRVGPDRVALGAAGLLATSGVLLQRRDLTRTSVRVLEAVIYTKAVTGFAKGLFSRSRPFVGAGPFSADPGEFAGSHTKMSMPSGHTARAFAVASVLAHEADRWYVSALAYGGAASVGLERVRSGDHWLTDVVVGGALGYLIGRSVVPSEASPEGVMYTPIVSTDRVGLSIRF